MIQRLARIPFWLIAILYFSTLTLLLFGDALFDPQRVISAPGSDLPQLFYPLRRFAFDEMKAGRLPLWNPYVMGGIPAYANSLYALLYPPNWLHLILPINLAINLIIAMHVLLAGLFTAIWCRWRGSSITASLLAGSMFMFAGPLLLRIYGGILTYPCVIAWTPLLMLCIDAIIEQRKAKVAMLAGAVILTMQVLAGYMLATYYQSFGIGCYAIVRLLHHPQWKRTTVLLLAMGLLAAGLSAGQLLPGIEAANESVRGVAQQSSFSTSVSLPPENLLTLFIPYLLGDWVSSPIFQRWGIVDTSLFAGGVGTMLAIIGAVVAVRTRDLRGIATLVCLVVTLGVALGEYNPLYKPAMRIIPGLAIFRGPSRASFVIVLAAAALAASGFDAMRTSRKLLPIAASAGAVAFALFGFAWLTLDSRDSGKDGLWGRILMHLVATGQTWYKLDTPAATRQIAASAAVASREMFSAAGIFAIASLLLILSRTRPLAIQLLLPVAILELWCGSVLAWDRFKPQMQTPPDWKPVVSQMQPDQRLLVARDGPLNLGMVLKLETINGYDPAIRQRWENVVAGLINAEVHTGILATKRFLPSKRWPMLRLGAVVPANPELVFDPPMPRLNLLTEYTVVADETASLQATRSPDFDPRKTVVLEQQPSIKPASDPTAASPGTVQLIGMTTDTLEIEADLQRPAILLITDAYSRGWQARPLGASPQSSYEVLPANHALRAIPLSIGSHHFILEYRPASVPVGFAISGITALVCCGLAVWFSRSARGAASARSLPEDYPSPGV